MYYNIYSYMSVLYQQTNLWSSTTAPVCVSVLLPVTVHSSVEHLHPRRDQNHLLTFIPKSERTIWSPNRHPRRLFLFLEWLSSFCWGQGRVRGKVNSSDALVRIGLCIFIHVCMMRCCLRPLRSLTSLTFQSLPRPAGARRRYSRWPLPKTHADA